MNYRRLRKKYVHRFGNSAFITLRDKSGRVMRRASKLATVALLKECLRRNCDSLQLIALVLKERERKMIKEQHNHLINFNTGE